MGGSRVFLRRGSFFATAFTEGLPYNRGICRAADSGKGERHDGGVHRQRLFFEYPDGLPSGTLRRAAGGDSSPAGPVPSGSPGGRGLRGGSFPAGTGVSGSRSGEAGGRRTPFSDCLWRRGAFFPSDPAAVFRLLRHGRLCAGAGTGNRKPGSGGKGYLLYGYQRRNSAGRRRGRLSGAGGGFPGGGKARAAGGTGSGPGLRFR